MILGGAKSLGGRREGNSPGLQDVQASLRRAPVACQLLPSLPLDQLVVQDDGLLLPQQLQCFLVLLCQILQDKNNNNDDDKNTENMELCACVSQSHDIAAFKGMVHAKMEIIAISRGKKC